ncbi:MAG: peptidoglycan-binding protein [Oscillospiraceae bacterium]|nr:peptidoglycan-binding protein [Oscillospiraceae bacterium]
MSKGILVIELRTGQDALPVGDSSIVVKAENGDTVYQGYIGNESAGFSEEIELDAPEISLSLAPDSAELPYSKYDVYVENPAFFPFDIQGIQIFGDTKAIQKLQMIATPVQTQYTPVSVDIGEHGLRLNEPKKPEYDGKVFAKKQVFIPAFITVHLGDPSSNAPNVNVDFKDYIKNVASSEIYPTWPENSLRANIIAQISLVLNRIYTEWYPEKGYNFNITSSPVYDQYFIYGRNIYDNISMIVDEIFNVYMIKPGRTEPFFAEYCNGSSITCNGMSQWGTVELADQGASVDAILKNYYGDINLVSTDVVRSTVGSYPGYPLKTGMSGEYVKSVQNQLNRIAVNYPSIPSYASDGVYGAETEDAVKEFQKLFDLTPNGIVDKSTWYQLSYVNSAVNKLSKLTSEGNSAVYNEYEYPGYPLKYGSSGDDVKKMQFFLDKISVFYPTVAPVSIDGKFGSGTKNSVMAFQRTFGLAQDGIVGAETWNQITNAYRGIGQNVIVPQQPAELTPFPGKPVYKGQQNENVEYIQRVLNSIGEVFSRIPALVPDGKFGNATYDAVVAFQSIFGLKEDGIVGQVTWNHMNEVYSAVASGCIYELDPDVPIVTYPGSPVGPGSTGTDVTYIQNSINKIRLLLAEIPRLTADGVYGPDTKKAVMIFQGIFGLQQDGIAGKDTWSMINYMLSAVSSGCMVPLVRIPTELPRGNGNANRPPLLGEDMQNYLNRM